MKRYFRNIVSTLKKQWLTMILVCALWTGLGHLWRIGVHNAILMIINYLTGAFQTGTEKKQEKVSAAQTSRNNIQVV